MKMRKSIVNIALVISALFLLSACGDIDVNSDLYDGTYAADEAISAGDEMFDGITYFNLAIQWAAFIDNQTMKGVLFPHDYHRTTIRNAVFLNTNGDGQQFVTGCTSCHGNDSSNRLFMQQKLTTTGQRISGTGLDNPAHEFCWTQCHNQIAVPSENVPTPTECYKCHKIENLTSSY